MATVAQCLYCFEVLSASLEKRRPLTLQQVEELWTQYKGDDGSEDEADEDQVSEEEVEVSNQQNPRPRQVSNLQTPSPASSSSTSTPSNASSQTLSSESSKASSRSSLFSFVRRSTAAKEEEHPLFITWNTVSARGSKYLRGCIGTFEPKKLSEGLRSYALTS
jgi:AMME syndrome candidate gene 1 protein